MLTRSPQRRLAVLSLHTLLRAQPQRIPGRPHASTDDRAEYRIEVVRHVIDAFPGYRLTVSDAGDVSLVWMRSNVRRSSGS